ncbi:hypothetical protein ACFVFJ_44065 [Streptomyces sp. NPDC057717]|uniref:hypothetical protein n=1 Tax=Streptomyces sp. NPDC057717 TaxID=3346224 RepID=UPI0036939EDB
MRRFATHSEPRGIILVTTDQDRLRALPEYEGASQLAAVIEHTVWHRGQTVVTVDLHPSLNRPLIGALAALLKAVPRGTPWSHLAALVGAAPDEGCHYCKLHT